MLARIFPLIIISGSLGPSPSKSRDSIVVLSPPASGESVIMRVVITSSSFTGVGLSSSLLQEARISNPSAKKASHLFVFIIVIKLNVNN